MSDVKKDHSVGAGTGAVAGAVAGAAVGSAAGPVGSAVGANRWRGGRQGGDSIAEAVNPTEYTANFQREYKKLPSYVAGREWSDYEPAYKYGYDTYGEYRGKSFDTVESECSASGMKPAMPHACHGTRPNMPCEMVGITSSARCRGCRSGRALNPESRRAR